MIRLLAAAALASTMTLPMITSASAQSPEFCGKRTEIIAKLAADFKEKSMASGVSTTSAVVEVFVSTDGTWTILGHRHRRQQLRGLRWEGWDSKILIRGGTPDGQTSSQGRIDDSSACVRRSAISRAVSSIASRSFLPARPG